MRCRAVQVLIALAPCRKNVWLGTLRLTRRDVESIYEPERMRKRCVAPRKAAWSGHPLTLLGCSTQRALLLGLSLAPLLELSSLPDFARAVLAVVAELDVMPDSAASGFSSLGGGGGKGAHGVVSRAAPLTSQSGYHRDCS
jgi:hypothetical protein